MGGHRPDQARAGVHRYPAFLGGHAADITDGVLTSPHAIRATNDAFARICADELFFMPGTDQLDDHRRLADTVL